jgi:hypothetical protein
VIVEVGYPAELVPWAITASAIHAWAAGAHALRSIALDLTDATGRVHATWCWRLRYCPAVPLDHWMRRSPELGGGYSLAGWADHPEYPDLLSDLDPDDPRTLPDGSRWVDAEALRRVVLHVAAVEVAATARA